MSKAAVMRPPAYIFGHREFAMGILAIRDASVTEIVEACSRIGQAVVASDCLSSAFLRVLAGLAREGLVRQVGDGEATVDTVFHALRPDEWSTNRW